MNIQIFKLRIQFLYFLLISIYCISCTNSNQTKGDSNANDILKETPSIDNNIENTVTIETVDMDLDNSQIIALPSDRLKEAINTKLSSDNKSLNTVNEDGSIYSIGISSTGIPSNRSGFINSRNIAYAKAELRAKIEILRLIGEVVTTERNSSLINKSQSGNDPDAKEKANFLEKIAVIADKSLDKALIKLGVNEAEIKKMNEEQKERAYSEAFNNYTSSYVASLIKGISIVKILEGEVGSNDYEVAVCAKYSPEYHSAVSNYKSLGASNSTINSNTVKNIKTFDEAKLMSKLGSRFITDENGQRFVVGYGQASVRKSDTRQSNFINIARKKARLKAVENIKNLLAEDLVGKEIAEDIEKIVIYKNGEESIFTENNFSELIKSKRSSVKLNTLELRSWEGVHPVSKTRVIGSVVILTESNNINFESSNSDQKNLDEKTQKSDYLESEDIEGEEF